MILSFSPVHEIPITTHGRAGHCAKHCLRQCVRRRRSAMRATFECADAGG